MNTPVFPRRAWTLFTVLGFILITAISAPAQQWVTETRDTKQAQDDYQVHPLHVEFLEKVFKRVCKRVVVYDFA